MVGAGSMNIITRFVTTPLALSCAAVEVNSSLQAMDWTVMVWHCYQRVEGGGGRGGRRRAKEVERAKPVYPTHKVLYRTKEGDDINSVVVSFVELLLEVQNLLNCRDL